MNYPLVIIVMAALLSLPTLAMILALGLCRTAKTADGERSGQRALRLPFGR